MIIGKQVLFYISCSNLLECVPIWSLNYVHSPLKTQDYSSVTSKLFLEQFSHLKLLLWLLLIKSFDYINLSNFLKQCTPFLYLMHPPPNVPFPVLPFYELGCTVVQFQREWRLIVSKLCSYRIISRGLNNKFHCIKISYSLQVTPSTPPHPYPYFHLWYRYWVRDLPLYLLPAPLSLFWNYLMLFHALQM